MIIHHKPTVVGALIGATLVIAYLWIRAATAQPAPVDLDAGVSTAALDRAALVTAPDAGVAAPPVEPRTIDEGFALGRWVWAQLKAGHVAPALIVLLQAIGLFAVRRWAWVSTRLPRLVRGKALAAVTSLTGSLAALVPLAVGGAAVAGPLVGALIAAVGVYLMPGPVEAAGQTVPG